MYLYSQAIYVKLSKKRGPATSLSLPGGIIPVHKLLSDFPTTTQSMLWTRFTYSPRLVRLIALSSNRRLSVLLAEFWLA